MLPPLQGAFGGKEVAILLEFPSSLFDEYPEAGRAGPGLIFEASLAFVIRECCELVEEWISNAELACRNEDKSKQIKQAFHG